MQDFTIKELGELINSINKTPDAAIEVTADKTGGATGVLLKITPYHPATDATPSDKTDDDV